MSLTSFASTIYHTNTETNSLFSVLPAPVREVAQKIEQETAEEIAERERIEASHSVNIPPYGQRGRGFSFMPKTLEDFGDGGSFPEIHICQYPLNLGRNRVNLANSTSTAAGALSTDSTGAVRFDAVLGHSRNAVVHSTPEASKGALIVASSSGNALNFERPPEEEVNEITERTREALDVIVGVKVAASQPSRGPAAAQRQASQTSSGPTYVKYTPSARTAETNGSSTTAQHQSLTVQLFERQSDPLEPAKFKTRRVPRGPASPPAPIMHSPPAKVTAKDMQAWKIPPCVSNWKNNRGYTIPLDKRLAADGRGLADVTVSDGFARLSESLYIAERNAREEVARRAELNKRYALKEKEKREEELLRLAESARLERAKATNVEMEKKVVPNDVGNGSRAEEELEEEANEREEREKLRDERRLEREREHRLEAYRGKRDKNVRDETGQRDFAEAIALGTHKTSGNGGGSELMYDQRLFNQSQGLTSGFGDEEDYNVYSRPLFTDGRSSAVYRPTKQSTTASGDVDEGGNEAGEEQKPLSNEDAENFVERISKTDRFRAESKASFSGVDRSKPIQPHSGPVEFERATESTNNAPSTTTTTTTTTAARTDDPFGVGEFLDNAKKAVTETERRKTVLDRIGSGGTMHAASASFGTRESYDGGSDRTTIGFRSGGNTQTEAQRDLQNSNRAPGLSEGNKHQRNETKDDDNDDGNKHERKRHHGDHHRHH